VLELFTAYHSNKINCYTYDLDVSKKESNPPKIQKIYGEFESHKLAVRSV
jgi:hypothetical protein